MSTESLCSRVWRDLNKEYDECKIHVEEEAEGKGALIRVMKKAYGHKYTEEWKRKMWEEERKRYDNAT